jgi:2-iminobutanoate/2-iminopropanoate deaminase
MKKFFYPASKYHILTEVKEMSDSPKKSKVPFSNSRKVGNMVFISGQIPKEIETGKWHTDIDAQTKTVLKKVKRFLEEEGAKLSDIVKITVYITDVRYYAKMNHAYIDFFAKNGVTENLPARSCVEVGALMYKDWKIELDCIAIIQ